MITIKSVSYVRATLAQYSYCDQIIKHRIAIVSFPLRGAQALQPGHQKWIFFLTD